MKIHHLALPLFFAVFFLLLALQVASATDISGDLVVSTSDTRADEMINITGSVIVQIGGYLTWTDVVLVVNSSSPGERGVFFDGTAILTRVTIRAQDPALPYVFRINSTASVTIETSDISDMYGTATDPGPSGTAAGTGFGTLVGGVQIYSTGARIGNSSIHDGWGVNIYVSGSSPRINANSIFAPHYLTFEYATAFGGSTQTSDFRAVAACVVLASGAARLDANTIENCGLDGSANATDLGTSNATLAVSNLRLVGAGVVVLGGFANFLSNGIADVVPLAVSSKAFTLGPVGVTHNYLRLAAWGVLVKNVPGLTVGGGFVRNATVGLELYGNASFAGAAMDYDLFSITFNGSFAAGIAANFGGLNVPVSLAISSITVSGGSGPAIVARFTSMSAAHTATVTASNIVQNGSGTGVSLEDRSSSGRPTLTVSFTTIGLTRAPISIILNGLTAGATVKVHNNTLTNSAGAANASLFPNPRGGIDLQWIGFVGSAMSVLIEDNRVYNQSWQLGMSTASGITVYSGGASGVTNSLVVRRNVVSNVSYGIYLEEDYGGNPQSSTYLIENNRAEITAFDAYHIESVSSLGTLDPSFDRNYADRPGGISSGYGVYWFISSALVPTRSFTNITVIGNGTRTPYGLYLLYGASAKWNLNLYDIFVQNTTYGFYFGVMNVNVYNSDISMTSTGVTCDQCFALLYSVDIYPLSASVTTNGEVTAHLEFASPRVQWQGDGGIPIIQGSLFLRWYGGGSGYLTLATIQLDSTSTVSPHAVAAWKKTASLSEQYANLTPAVRVNSLDVLGLNIPFVRDFYGNVTLFDPELPDVTYSTPGAFSQLRTRTVSVKGTAADPTTGLETVQISYDGVSFVNVTTIDLIGGAWNHTLTFPADGIYNITLRAWDRARWAITNGTYTTGFREIAIPQIVVDTVLPSVVIYSPLTDLTTSKATYPVDGQVNDANPLGAFQVTFNGLVIPVTYDALGRFNFTLSGMNEGTNQLAVLATDLAGNTNVATRTITLDTAPPHLVIYSPGNNSFTNRAGLEVTGEFEAGVAISVNGQPGATLPWRVSLRLGENRIWVNATDAGSNMKNILLVVTLDSTLPTVSFTQPTRFPFATNSPRVVLAGRASEPLSAVFINNISYPLEPGNLTFTVELFFEDGSYPVVIRIIDLANNTAEANPSPVFIVDTVAPLLVIDSPGDRSVQNSRNVQIRGRTDPRSFLNVSSPIGRFALNVNAVTGQFVFDDTRTFDGVYPYTFEASDAVGNRLLLSLQITVDTTPPAIEILGLSTNERTTDDHVRLRGTVSAGSTLTVNGAPVAVDCALGPSGNCDYDVVIPLPVGTNPISLVATDGAGNQAARNIFVQRAEAPVAPAGPDLSFALVLLGVVGGVALMLFFFRRARTEAAAKHPQLTLGKGKKRRLASAPPPPAQVIYEGSGQDMYAADFQTRSQRQARPPYGGA